MWYTKLYNISYYIFKAKYPFSQLPSKHMKVLVIHHTKFDVTKNEAVRDKITVNLVGYTVLSLRPCLIFTTHFPEYWLTAVGDRGQLLLTS